MPVPRSGGLDGDVEADALGLGAKSGLGEGRATDVAEADEEDGGHGLDDLGKLRRFSPRISR